MTLTKEEIQNRIQTLWHHMNQKAPNWDNLLIFGKMNQYYYTGTMQDGVFALRRDGSYRYFIRRSFQRGNLEAKITECTPMTNYRSLYDFLGTDLGNLYLDKDIVNLSILDRLKKYFPIEVINSADRILSEVRSVKSPYELEKIKISGKKHQQILQSVVPGLLKEGISEVTLFSSLYEKMLEAGYHGLARFSMHQVEMALGQFGFGTNAIYPARFDGPGGMKGMSPVVPMVGDPDRRLQKGDLVFIDIAFGVDGYHTDCTQIYQFGGAIDSELLKTHNRCREIEKQAADLLRPGAIPSEIYQQTVGTLPEEFLENFMGIGNERVRFLGHGIGLEIDEYPVIAKGFQAPLEENMVIALEPKKSIPGAGIVGVEDSYIVTPSGGVCVTGGEREIFLIS